MNKVKIYYFTGSGNTLRIAEHVKMAFESFGYVCELEAMENVKNISTECYEWVGLMFPVALQSTYPLVWDFVDRMPNMIGQKIFMIDTLMSFSGGIVGPMKKVLTEKGYNCLGAIELKMSNSMNTKSIASKKYQLKHQKALNQADDFIKKLVNKQTQWKRIPVVSDGMRLISKGHKIWESTSRKISISKASCVLCQICVRKCPTQALSMNQDEIAINHQHCISCMRCVHQCPKGAFRISGKQLVKF